MLSPSTARSSSSFLQASSRTLEQKIMREKEWPERNTYIKVERGREINTWPMLGNYGCDCIPSSSSLLSL